MFIKKMMTILIPIILFLVSCGKGPDEAPEYLSGYNIIGKVEYRDNKYLNE